MESEFRLAPEAASVFAAQVDTFFYFMVSVSLFFTFLVAALVIFFAVRYRRRKALEKGAVMHGNIPLEITWSVIPLVLSMVMFFWAAHLYFHYARPPGDAMEILVTGKQWMWKIQHSTGKRTDQGRETPRRPL